MKTPFEEVMEIRGSDLAAPTDVTITGVDPVFSTRFKVGETCAAVLAGIGVAISDIWALKTGRGQKVAIDTRHAAATLRSTTYMETPDAGGTFKPVVNEAHEEMINRTQPWPTKDGRWFLPHFGLPHLGARVLGVLDCEPNPGSVADAVLKWDALDLEDAIDDIRACGGMVRSNEEWLAHPHGQVLAAKPIVEIIKIGDSEPEPFPVGERPLSGIRALDLTRILAGPIAARTLAENGADVLMITADHLPQIAEHVMDTSHGKRSTFLNLKTPEGVAKLKDLAKDTDVFSQGYRPGMLEDLGFGPEELAKVRPGIVYLSISCFGADGPLSHRAGWEQVAQTVTGLAHDGEAGENGTDPALLPAAACDYTTGYLGAYGIMLALARRAREGGSYHVRVSLCQSGMFIYRQGKTGAITPDMDLNQQELAGLQVDSETAAGPLRHLGPVLQLSETRPHWTRPTPVMGEHAAEWLNDAADKAADAAE
ncbi:MAG: CoA transferase [Alphaproteobacteria bacterium]|nr:CoA transferase [Alphaproteobacteria bacterium]